MKRTLTILVVVATLFASFSKAFVMGAFLINQANISKTLCENRNQPKKHCDGKCYLKKQMTKDEKKDKSSVPFSLNDIFQEFVWVNTPLEPISCSFYGEEVSTTFFTKEEVCYSHFYYSEIPHPPSKA